MAYGDGCAFCSRILYWSNPDVTRNGEAMGRAEGQTNAADNRKTLNNTASTVANWRQEVGSTPGAATLVSPIGGASVSTLTPTYTWNPVTAATWYYLWLQDELGNVLAQTWYQGAAVCGSSTCSVTPAVTTTNGHGHSWWIQSWNNAGYGLWSAQGTFRVNAATPPPATVLLSPTGGVMVSTSRPTYTWNKVNEATWYYIWLQDTVGNLLLTSWYQGTAVCGASTCSVTPAATLVGGTTYRWWIQTWNAVGYGPWSARGDFTPSNLSLPPATTLVSPAASASVSTLRPTYSWNAVASASWYQIWLQDNVGNLLLTSWYQAASVCDSSTCTVTPDMILIGGRIHYWWIQTWNNAGFGPWSGRGDFVPSVGPATHRAPSGTIGDQRPPYSWFRVPGATWYRLWIAERATGTLLHDQWYEAGTVCGSLVCSKTLALPLVPGTGYVWWMQTLAGSFGPWSGPSTFTPASSTPGAASHSALVSAQFGPTPTFSWTKVAGASWYFVYVIDSTSAVRIATWYHADDVCSSGGCSVTSNVALTSGAYQWWVQTYNDIGLGLWSAGQSFSVQAPDIGITLSWGSEPGDLDAHVLTPLIGGSRHHVYYGNSGTAAAAPFATHRNDSRNGYGPETISIHRAASGVYRYFARRRAGTGTLAGSGAQARVYVGDTLIGTYTVPSTGTGDYWHVCDVIATTGTIVCPNTIGGEEPTYADGTEMDTQDVEKPTAGVRPMKAVDPPVNAADRPPVKQ
jgi:hypothetical protein